MSDDKVVPFVVPKPGNAQQPAADATPFVGYTPAFAADFYRRDSDGVPMISMRGTYQVDPMTLEEWGAILSEVSAMMFRQARILRQPDVPPHPVA